MAPPGGSHPAARGDGPRESLTRPALACDGAPGGIPTAPRTQSGRCHGENLYGESARRQTMRTSNGPAALRKSKLSVISCRSAF